MHPHANGHLKPQSSAQPQLELGLKVVNGRMLFSVPSDYIAAAGMLKLLTEYVESKSPLRQQMAATPIAPPIEVPSPEQARAAELLNSVVG